jgi:hypothetical protein
LAYKAFAIWTAVPNGAVGGLAGYHFASTLTNGRLNGGCTTARLTKSDLFFGLGKRIRASSGNPRYCLTQSR